MPSIDGKVSYHCSDQSESKQMSSKTLCSRILRGLVRFLFLLFKGINLLKKKKKFEVKTIKRFVDSKFAIYYEE